MIAVHAAQDGAHERQPTQRNPGDGMTRTYGNIVLIATISVLVFWVFMALRPAQALPKCTSKLECAARQINRARNDGSIAECRTSFVAKAYMGGDARMRRVVDEYQRRGGGVGRGVDAANSMRNEPDWQWAAARANRACAKYAR